MARRRRACDRLVSVNAYRLARRARTETLTFACKAMLRSGVRIGCVRRVKTPHRLRMRSATSPRDGEEKEGVRSTKDWVRNRPENGVEDDGDEDEFDAEANAGAGEEAGEDEECE